MPPSTERAAKGGRVPPSCCAAGPKVLSVGTLVRGACSGDGVNSLMTEDPGTTVRVCYLASGDPDVTGVLPFGGTATA